MNEVKLYENKEIRAVWDDETEEWYFSVVDVVAVLTESKDPSAYWRKLKQRLKDEGNESVTNCHALKMRSRKDRKMYKTDVADVKGIFRVIQTIPSPKAEPFKMWLAQVGKERIDEVIDPELTIDRALKTYLKKDIQENGSIKDFRQFK
jgi:prophage antirepressor-like protein